MSFEITPFDNYDEFKVDPMSAVTKTAKKEIRRILDYAVKHSDISRKEFISGVKTGTVKEYGDDGVTQKAVVKTGVASLSEAIAPNPVTLKPFRTFPEIEQPVSMFVFRMKDNGDGIVCGLFEADGGAWKVRAMKLIQAYLKESLTDMPDICILA